MKQAAGRYHYAPSRRRWGQNFLRDHTVADRIVAAIAPCPDDLFLEIGPGEGVLTQRLAGLSAGVAAIEIDPLLASILREGLAKRHQHLKILEADALNVGPEQVLTLLDSAGENSRKLRLAGNLPFNISVPLVRHWMEHLPWVQDMTFMVQREVADRMTARPSTSAYGFLSLLVQMNCTAKPLLKVHREAFRPKPNVDATVVQLTPLETAPLPVDQHRWLLEMVSIAFRSRRKTLFNNLRNDSRFAGEDERLSAILQERGLARERRGETLDLDEFAALARDLAPLAEVAAAERGNDDEEKEKGRGR